MTTNPQIPARITLSEASWLESWTPGPWAVVPEPHTEPTKTDIPRFRVGAQGGRQPIIDGYALHVEDAYLISAAPDMAEALHNLIELARPYMRDEAQLIGLDEARAALAKARGEAQ